MRRLMLSALVVLACVAPAAAQTRVAGSDTSGGPVPIGNFGNALLTSNVATSSAIINQSSATTTELVALTAGQTIYVYGWEINVIGVAGPATWKLVYGTGTNCGTGTTDLTGVHASTTTTTAIEHFDYNGGSAYVVKAPVSNAVCITTTTTTPQRGTLLFAKF